MHEVLFAITYVCFGFGSYCVEDHFRLQDVYQAYTESNCTKEFASGTLLVSVKPGSTIKRAYCEYENDGPSFQYAYNFKTGTRRTVFPDP